MNSLKHRCVQLSWQILEYKCCYYNINYIHPKYRDKLIVRDTVYDSIESEYKEICSTLGIEPTATNMVGFDNNRPCCQLVRKKYVK